MNLATETDPSVGETSGETPLASSPATSQNATGQGSDAISEETPPTSKPATSADDELTDPEDPQAVPVSLLSFDDCESLLSHLSYEYNNQAGYDPEYVDNSFKTHPLNKGPFYGALESNLTFSAFTTDGRRIYTVSADRFGRQRLVVINAHTKRVVGEVVIPWTAVETLLLDGDNLLVIGDYYHHDGYTDEKITVIQRIRVENDTPELWRHLELKADILLPIMSKGWPD